MASSKWDVSPTRGGISGPERRLCPSPEKCTLRAEKLKFGAYFCVLLLFEHEIIVEHFGEMLFKLQELGE